MRAGARLEAELSPAALRAGERLRGLITLRLERPLRLRRLWVLAEGRELIGAPARYLPAGYQIPLPRPWGRIRTGRSHVDFEARQMLLGPAPPADRAARLAEQRVAPSIALAAGVHTFAFGLATPLGALPTYAGQLVQIEHGVTVRAELADGVLAVWQPFHLWSAAGRPPVTEPVELEAVHDAGGQPGLRLQAIVPEGGVRIGEPLHVEWRVENPHLLDLRHLVMELSGVERARHLAATDEESYLVARRLLRLRDVDRQAGSVVWRLPPRVAPTLTGKRFTLRWRLRVSVTRPWRLGLAAQAELPAWDETGAG